MGIVVNVLAVATIMAQCVSAGRVAHQDPEDAFLFDAVSLLDECGAKHITLCIKERALNYIEQLPSDIDVGGGLTIKRTDEGAVQSPRSARFFSANQLPEDSKARETSLDNILMDRIVSYLSSHTFEFKVPQDTILELQRSLQDTDDEARAKNKKKKGISMMSLIHMKAIMIGALALKAIGLIAFKAFVMAKVALAVTAIIALKKLLEHKHSSTYEVVAHPYEEHGHYDRSFDVPIGGAVVASSSSGGDLPYKGYEKKLLSF